MAGQRALTRAPGSRLRDAAVPAAVAVLLLGGTRALHAQQWAYGSNTAGIRRINTATAASTVVYSGAPFPTGAAVAALAQRPSDGVLFFIVGTAGNDAVYSWDPATPAIPAAALGTTGAGVPYLPRLGFDLATGTLYGINAATTQIYAVNQTTGAATPSGAALTGGPAGLKDGDLAIHPTTGLIYLVSGPSPVRLYRLAVTGGAVTSMGNITGLPGTPTGASFNAAGTLFVQSSASTNLYTLPLTAGAVTLVGASGAAFQDLASVPVAVPTAAKSFTPDTVGQTGPSQLTVTLTNPAAVPHRGAALTDTYPAGLVNAGTPAAVTTCGGTATAAAGGGSVTLSGGTIPAGGSCTVTVNVTSAMTGSYLNTIAAGGITTVLGAVSTATSATLTVIRRSDLSVTKTDGVTTVVQGDPVTYTITVTNLGPEAVTGATLSDVFPANLSGASWTCTATAGSSCTAAGSGDIAASVSLLVGGTATFSATATASGTGTIVNTATAAPPVGTDDPPGNSSATDGNTLIIVLSVSVTPDGLDTIPRLPTSGGAGLYSYTFTLTNTSNGAESFDLLASAGAPGAYLTIDSITGAGITRGAPPDSARLATIGAGAAAAVTVWYRVGSAATGALDTVQLLGRSLLRPATARDSGWSLVRIARPSLVLAKGAAPAGALAPGTEVTYTVDVTNAGTENAVNVISVDSIAPEVAFKVGSVTSVLPPGVSASVAYSQDGGLTWGYTPASGGCGAPAGFDRCVNRVRWTFLNPLSNSAPNNTAQLGFVVRIQ